jgi:hypothetical protein
MNKTPVDLMNEAVNALFLELPQSVAYAVREKWGNAYNYLTAESPSRSKGLTHEQAMQDDFQVPNHVKIEGGGLDEVAKLEREISYIKRNVEKINDITWKTYKEQALAHIEDAEYHIKLALTRSEGEQGEYWKNLYKSLYEYSIEIDEDDFTERQDFEDAKVKAFDKWQTLIKK